MSIQDVVDQLLDAKNKLATAERAASRAATDLQHAEDLLAAALDGVRDLSVVGRITEKRMWVLAGLGGMALLRSEVDTAIRRVRSIAGNPRSFVVEWDNGHRSEEISSPGELDAVLDRIEAQHASNGVPLIVDLYQHRDDGSLGHGLQLQVGDPDRTRLNWTGTPDGDAGSDAPASGGLCGPEVSAAVAREAARQYVRSGQRPTCVSWAQE